MKARPRHVENRVADELNLFLDRHAIPRTERIPVLGRTGPDLTPIKWIDLAIDVKSRLSVPKSMLAPQGKSLQAGPMIAVRIGELDAWLGEPSVICREPYSTVVLGWLEHMSVWVNEEFGGGIPGIVLHIPGTRVSNATLVVYQSDMRRLYDKYRYFHDYLQLRAGVEHGAGRVTCPHNLYQFLC